MPAIAIDTTNLESVNPFQTAFDATTADRDAIADGELVTVNIDVPAAVTTVCGVLARLGAFRAEIAAKASSSAVDSLDKSEVYARALSHANTLYLAAMLPIEQLPELAQQALKYRELMLADAKALVAHGIIEPRPLSELKGGSGYLNLATDLSVLVRVFRERWSDIAQKTALDPNDITEAEKLFVQMSRACVDRTQPSAELVRATEDRQRAFTLFVKAYDQVRRLVTYVRWENDDADKLAPSLWTNRGRAGSSNASNKTALPAPAGVPSPSPTQAPVPATASPPALPIGHPNSSPFADN